MRILPAFVPLSLSAARFPAPVLALGVALCLSGCASKNPLIDDPQAKIEAKPAAAVVAAAPPEAAKPVAQVEAKADVKTEPAVAIKAEAKPEATPAAATAAAPAAAATTAAAAAPQVKVVDGQTITQVPSPTGIKRLFWFFSPYRVDIQQGNFISEEMVAQLKDGMTREQVRFVLGTPLISDVFHNDRWDYAFRLKKGNGQLTSSRVTVYFKDGKMARFEGGNLPTEKDYIAQIAGPAFGAKK